MRGGDRTRADRDLLVASDHQRETIEYLLDFFGIEELFEVASGRESGVEGLEGKKPSPHSLERALTDLGVEAARTLAVGDSNADIEAARGANVDSAFLRRPRCAEYVLDSRPTHEITSLTELSTLRPEVQ